MGLSAPHVLGRPHTCIGSTIKQEKVSQNLNPY